MSRCGVSVRPPKLTPRAHELEARGEPHQPEGVNDAVELAVGTIIVLGAITCSAIHGTLFINSLRRGGGCAHTVYENARNSGNV